MPNITKKEAKQALAKLNETDIEKSIQQAEQSLQTINNGLNNAKNLQDLLNNLTPHQKDALVEYTIRSIQLKISSNKALLKDMIDGGVGFIPAVGDLCQLIITTYILVMFYKEAKSVDTKTLLTILAITAADVGPSIVSGFGDTFDVGFTANMLISYYIQNKHNQSLQKCIELEIHDNVLRSITDSPQQVLKQLTTEQ